MRAPDGTAYDLTGPAGAPVVALIHGLGLCRDIWAPLLPALTGRWRVLNYDLYGHGESAPSRETGALSLYARQLAGLMDHCGVAGSAVVGFSIGGMINRRFALDFPERTTALGILNSPHDRGAKGQEAVEARARAARDQGAEATLEAALDRWFTPEFRAARKDVMETVRTWRRAADPRSYADAAWVLAHGVRELIRPVPAITSPVLVMTSAEDVGSTPAMSRAIAAEIDGAETIIVPALRHLGMMEAPEAFGAPLVDFLKRRAPS